MPERFKLKISKPGYDVTQAQPSELCFDSDLDTLKIAYTGSISLLLPSETINFDTEVYTEVFAHNLSYIPLYLPLAKDLVYTDDLASGGDYDVNDLSDVGIPAGGYSPDTVGEVIRLVVDDTNLTLEITRYNSLPFDQNFGTRTATVHYTILYNRVDEEFDLLT